MTLSKVISISKKRSSLALLMLLFTMQLSAASYRVGVCSSFSDPAFDDTVRAAISFSAAAVENPLLLNEAIKRDEAKDKKEYEISAASAVAAEKDKPSYVEKDHAAEIYEIEPVFLNLPEAQLEFVEKGDGDAVSYIMALNDLDELVFFSKFSYGALEELEIWINGSLEEILFPPLDNSGYFKLLSSFFLSRWRGNDYSIVRFEGNVPYTVESDGNEVEMYDRYAVLKNGSHELVLSYPYHADFEAVLETPVSSAVYFSLEKDDGKPLFISTLPYSEEIRLNGEIVEDGYVEDTFLPFSLSIGCEGYETGMIQGASNPGLIEISLLPSALYEPDYLEIAKKDFYSNLLLTLASFGAGIAIGFVNDVYSLDYLVPLETLAAGISVFQLIRTIDGLFKYRDALALGI